MADYALKPSIDGRYWIMDHYDSVVNQIDYFCEDLLQKKRTLSSQSDIELLQKRRIETIDLVRQLEEKALEFLKENADEFNRLAHLDEVDLKKRIFGDNYCFILKSEEQTSCFLVLDSCYIKRVYIDYLQELINSKFTVQMQASIIDNDFVLGIHMQKIRNAILESENKEKLKVITRQELRDIEILYFENDPNRPRPRLETYLQRDLEESCNLNYVAALFEGVGKTSISDTSNEYLIHLASSLKVLSISGASLEKSHSQMFYPLINLKFLEINGKGLDERSSLCDEFEEFTFDTLKQLESLYLINLKLKIVRQRLFMRLENLKNLDLSYNKIGYLFDSTFKFLTNLQYLNLTHNKLTTIRKYMFAGLNQLYQINLNGNRIKSIEANSFADINLSILLLDFNYLTSIAENSLPDSLEHLFLSFNPITSSALPAFRNLTNLKGLALYRTKLTEADKLNLKKMLPNTDVY